MNRNHKFNFVYAVIPDDNSTLYSVCCYDENEKAITIIDKIGTRETAVKFCNFLNEGKVHPCHFEDIFEDYFG